MRDRSSDVCSSDLNQRVIADIAPDIQQVFASKISKKTIELFAPLAENIAERVGEGKSAKTSRGGATELSENAARSAPNNTATTTQNSANLPSSITPYAQVLALSIAHTAQEAIDANSTKPLTAWKNKWCEKNAASEFVLKDFTAS